MIAKISGTILYLFSVLVYKTCRFHISGIEKFEAYIESGEPVIVTSWHGKTMMIAGSMMKYLNKYLAMVIIPDDSRGKTLDVFIRRLGAEPVQLNLTGDITLGLSRSLVRVVQKIASGRSLLVHPDGPGGPAYVVKPGLSFLAKKSRAVIVPIGCYCRHAYHVPRWDRYTLPLPFSKIHIQVGDFITIPEDLQDLSETNQQITDILHRVSAQASANYYELKSC